MLSETFYSLSCHYAGHHYAECHYAERRYVECHNAEFGCADCSGSILNTAPDYSASSPR